MKVVFKIVFVIIGTLIGAGFASGQEIYSFFFSYGEEGIIGIIASSLLMGLVIYKTLSIILNEEIKTYKDFLGRFCKRKKENILNNIINIVVNIFILVTFFIMIAGFGAYFGQELGLNSLIGSSILSVFSFFIFMTSVRGVIKVNEILVPILILFVLIIGLINIKEIDILNLGNYLIKTNNSNYLLSAILYCSYNSILLIPVLITLKEYIKTRKQVISISCIVTVITIMLSFIIFLLLVRVEVDINKLEMPVVYVVSHIHKILKIGYGFIILSSIFTTAISLGTSFLQNVSKNKKSYTQIALIMCITSVIVSEIGFSNLINSLYPIFGYLGLVQIFRLFI